MQSNNLKKGSALTKKQGALESEPVN